MIIQENIRQFVNNLVDNYREKLEKIKYVDTFSNIIIRWEQWNERAPQVLPSTPDDRNRNRVNGGRWQGVKEPDASEEEYFNTSDDEEETIFVKDLPASKQLRAAASPLRGNGRLSKPLVEYEDEDDVMEGIGDAAATTTNNVIDTRKSISNTQNTVPTLKLRHAAATSSSSPPSPTNATIPTPERLAEKRRRTELEDDDDELGKLSVRSKKRTSSPTTDGKSAGGLQRKRSGTGLSSGVWGAEGVVEPAKKKIAISLNAGKAGSSMGITTSTVNTASTTPTEKVAKRAIKVVEGEGSVEAEDGGVLTDDCLDKLTMENGEKSEVQLDSALNPSSGIGTRDGGGDGGGQESDGNKE